MRYVGNTALSPQIQERIQATFQQTLSLAEEGNRQEALLGCDFILRLDPLFEPARSLQGRLSEGEGPVDTANLMEPSPEAKSPAPAESPTPVESDAPSPAVEAPVEFRETIDEQPVDMSEPDGDDLVDLGELIAEEPAEEPSFEVPPLPDLAAEVEPPIDDLPARIAMLFEQRNFRDLMTLAMENQERVGSDADLKQLVDSASERLEAEPYVRNFIDSAQSAKERGDLENARAHLEKARELDPTHPELTRLEADLQSASVVEPPAAFEPPPLVETPPLLEPEPLDPPASDVEELFAPIEEPAPEPSEEAPAEEAPVEVPQAIPSLDAEPSARLDTESEQRIDELLKEGQESFEDGQYQTAIDAWSRIFLIDIDHAEASRRIELARKLKAEVERQIEETFHEGISLLESGDEEKACKAFDRVLEIQPNHMGARDYLEKLSSGDLGTSGAKPTPDLTPVVDEAPAAETAFDEEMVEVDLDQSTGSQAPGFGDLAPEDVVPAPSSASSRGRSFVLIGATVLVVVLAIGWFVFSKWDRFFPGSAPADQAATAETRIDPIERARELHEAGDTAMAINVLRRLAPGHDQYSEALALISMWEGDEPEVEVESEAPSEEILALRQELASQAERAIASGENILALDILAEASQISDLTEEELQLERQASNQLEPLEEELDLFEQGDWEYSLPSLWRKHDADGNNKDVLRLMVDSYYNLGLRDLQRGDAKAALEKFEEARDLSGDDAGLNRLAEFASAYKERQADMLFRIFVKYQKFR